MDWLSIQKILFLIQHYISFAGVLIILSGVLFALCQYLYFIFSSHPIKHGVKINEIRLTFGRILILGLELIVAADSYRHNHDTGLLCCGHCSYHCAYSYFVKLHLKQGNIIFE